MNATRIEQLKEEVAKLQAIQKTHAPSTSAWQVASDLLQPLFAEISTLANGELA